MPAKTRCRIVLTAAIILGCLGGILAFSAQLDTIHDDGRLFGTGLALLVLGGLLAGNSLLALAVIPKANRDAYEMGFHAGEARGYRERDAECREAHAPQAVDARRRFTAGRRSHVDVDVERIG